MIKKGTVGLCIYTLFLAAVPFSYQSIYAFLACLIGSSVSIVSLSLIFTFLGRNPQQQTITNLLIKQACCLYSLFVIRELTIAFFFNLLYALTKSTFETYPTLICSISTSRITVLPMMLHYCLMVASKLYLTFYSLQFVGLNHEMLGYLAIATSALLTVLDCGLKLVFNHTMCNSSYLEVRLIGVFNLNISTNIGDSFLFPWPAFMGATG